jgi:hypothetical protein
MTQRLHANTWIEVKPVHCHKRLEENTLVQKLRPISKDKKQCELLLKFNPTELGFFFDHEIDHLPGLLQICALRQCSLALAHLVYDVPQDYVTILDWIKVKLYNYGELDKESVVKSSLLEDEREKNRIILVLEGLLVQEDYPVIRMRGKLVALSPLLAGKIRRRKNYSRGVDNVETFDS